MINIGDKVEILFGRPEKVYGTVTDTMPIPSLGVMAYEIEIHREDGDWPKMALLSENSVRKVDNEKENND